VKKKISFVIPSFNCAAWLPHAVKSCQEQTYENIEIVIIDDCSTDSTEQYINWLLKQGDKRIVYHRNGTNLGRSESRNIGNKLATGDIICVLDADDLNVATRAEWTLKKMKNSQVIYGSAVVMDALGNALNEIHAEPIDFATCVKRKLNGIVHSTMAYTKEIALKYPYEGGKIADLGIDDYTMQIRMLADGVKFDFIPDIISAYRILETGISKTRDEKEVTKVKEEILEGLKCKI
jgi:glycosyltransferase involved in cell wall biosynthesis